MLSQTSGRNENQRVVVAGVDGSPGSEAALLWAADEAYRTHALLRVVLVRVNPAPVKVLASQPVWPWPVVNRRDMAAVEQASKFLSEFVGATLAEEQIPACELECVMAMPPSRCWARWLSMRRTCSFSVAGA